MVPRIRMIAVEVLSCLILNILYFKGRAYSLLMDQTEIWKSGVMDDIYFGE